MSNRKILKQPPAPPVNIKPPFITAKEVTLTEQGPTDAQRREDGYGGHVGPSKTAFATSIGKYIDDAMTAYKPVGGLFATIANILNSNSSMGFTNLLNNITPEGLIDSISKALGGRSIQSLVGQAGDFIKSVQKNIGNIRKTVSTYLTNFRNLVAAGKKLYGKTKAFYNQLKNNDWKSFAGIVKGLGIISPTLGKFAKDLMDKVGEGVIVYESMKNLIKQGRLDLVEMFGKKNKNNPDFRNALLHSLNDSIDTGDISALNLAVDFLGGDIILRHKPNFFNDVMRNYKQGPFYSPATARQERGRLLNLFEKTKKDWQYVKRGNEKITNLAVFAGISKHVKNLLLSVPPLTEKEINKIKTMIEEAKRNAPNEETIKRLYEDYKQQHFGDSDIMSYEEFRREQLTIILPGGEHVSLDDAERIVEAWSVYGNKLWVPGGEYDPYDDDEKYDFRTEIMIANTLDYTTKNIRDIANKNFKRLHLGWIPPMVVTR